MPERNVFFWGSLPYSYNMKILHLVSPSSLPSWLGCRSISSSSDESSSEPSSTFSCFRFLIIAATALLYYCQLWLYYCIKATFTPVWNCTTRSSTRAKCLLQPGSNSRATVSTPTMGLGSLHSTFQALHVLLGAQFSHLITLSFAIAILLICLSFRLGWFSKSASKVKAIQ